MWKKCYKNFSRRIFSAPIPFKRYRNTSECGTAYTEFFHQSKNNVVLFSESISSGIKFKKLNRKTNGGRIDKKAFNGAKAQHLNQYLVLSLEEYEYDFAIIIIIIVFYLGFLSRTFMIHRQQGKGEAISLSPLYHFHPLHRHLDISRAITAESSPLHIASSWTWTGNLWFLSASR